MKIKETFISAEDTLKKYHNIIGIGVLIMLIVFSSIFIFTYIQERKIAENCGFIDEKIKCVCTKNAWEEFKLKDNRYDNNEINLSIYDNE